MRKCSHPVFGSMFDMGCHWFGRGTLESVEFGIFHCGTAELILPISEVTYL